MLSRVGSLDFRATKPELAARIRQKDWWITHLDKVRCDPTAEAKGRFHSCLSSKRSAVSARTGLALKSPRFQGELWQLLSEKPRSNNHLNSLEEITTLAPGHTAPRSAQFRPHPPLLVESPLRHPIRCRRQHTLELSQRAALRFTLFACAS